MAIAKLTQLGSGAYLAKTDIKAASRLKIFEEFSTALQWVAHNERGVSNMLHILDDFLFIDLSKEKSQASLNSFTQLCSQLGVPLAADKTEGPAQCLTFAGIELDTLKMEARLPREKIVKYQAAISDAAKKKKITLRDLQSLIGCLNHCCYVIPTGRAFLRRLIELTIGVKQPHHHIRFNKEVKADLNTWDIFLETFNGKAMFRDRVWEAPGVLHVYTDASQLHGYGAVLGNNWFNGRWPLSWAAHHITILELYPIFASIFTWHNKLANKRIIFFTDNFAIVHILNSSSSKSPVIMQLVRRFVLQAMRRNILFKSEHIPGIYNNLADTLSRSRLQEFRQIAPSAQLHPCQIPPQVLPMNLTIQ
jgi:hypothetical protein